MIIAVDFDGTCVEHRYPAVGKDVPGAEAVLNRLCREGHELILWTMRSGKELDDAVVWFMERDIPLIGINENKDQGSWTQSPKAFANVYIDDAALGCPLIYPPGGHDRPYVDWGRVRFLLSERA